MRKMFTALLMILAMLAPSLVLAAPANAHGGQQFWYHCAATETKHDWNTMRATTTELSGGHVNSCTAGYTLLCAKYVGGGIYQYQYRYKTITDSSGGNGGVTGYRDCGSGFQYFNSWIGWVDTN